MNKVMGYFFFHIRMSIIPCPSSRQMKNNTFSVQYSDEIITRSILRSHEGNFARGLELLVHFQIGVGFRVIGGFSHVASFGRFSW